MLEYSVLFYKVSGLLIGAVVGWFSGSMVSYPIYLYLREKKSYSEIKADIIAITIGSIAIVGLFYWLQ